MAITSFANAASGSLTENIEKKILAGISATGKYTFTTELTPGIYSCKTKMLSDSAATPSVALNLGTSGKVVSVDSASGALFKVTSNEAGGVFNSYTSNLSTTETTISNIYSPGFNAINVGVYNGDSDYGFRITAYNPTSGTYVGNDWASNANSYKYQKSTDLKTWTDITMPTLNGSDPTAQYYGKVHWLNNTWIYAYFDNNQSRMRYATSADLTNWTYAGQFPEQSYYSGNDSFVYFNGYYYAQIMSRYAIYRSADLATWTQVYSGNVAGALATNGTSIMASMDAAILHSTDGTTWTSKTNTYSYGNFFFAAAQPSGDYMFMNTNGALLRYDSTGGLLGAAQNLANGGSYFYVTNTDSMSAKLTWHVDKFYVLGRWDYNGRYDGIWPITGVSATWNNQLFSYSSDSRSQYKSIFSNGTNLYAMVRTSTQLSSGNWWHNFALVRLDSARVVEIIKGTTAPMGSIQVGTGSFQIRIMANTQARHIEYTFNSGQNWYATILDDNYYGGNLYALYSAHKNIFIDSDNQGFVALMQISSTIYALRGVKNGNGFTFTITYIYSGSGGNAGLSKLREGEFAIGVSNTQMLYSKNYGASWTQTTFQANNNTGWGFYQGLYNPLDGMYYGFDGATTVTYRTSPDLHTWGGSVAVTGNPGAIYKAVYANKVAVVFGTNNYSYSLDMKTWTLINQGSYGNSNQIEVGADGMWCISGQGGIFKVSATGKSFVDIPFTKPSQITGYYMSGYANGKGFCIGTDYLIKSRERLTEPNTIFELYKTSYGEL